MPDFKVWNGSSFTDGDPKIWNGSTFVAPSEINIWDGSAFQKVWPSGAPITIVGTDNYTASAGTTAGTASITPTLPTGTAVGDRVFVVSFHSPYGLSTQNAWSELYPGSTGYVGIGGTGTPGAGTGPRRINIYYKDYDGVWTPGYFRFSSSSTQRAHVLWIFTLRKDAGVAWSTPTLSPIGDDPTVNDSFSATTGSFTTHTGGLLIMAPEFSRYYISGQATAMTTSNWSVSGSATAFSPAAGGDLAMRGIGTGNQVNSFIGIYDVTSPGTGTLSASATTNAGANFTAGVVFFEQTVS